MRLVLFAALWVWQMASAQMTSPPLPDPAKRFPVTHTAQDVAAAKLSPDQWEGKAAAVEGVITDVHWRPTGEPSLLINITESAETVWVEFLAPVKTFVPGTIVRALGFFRSVASLTSKDDQVSRDLRARTTDRVVLLTYCVLDPATEKLSARGQQVSFCALWQRGRLPEDIK